MSCYIRESPRKIVIVTDSLSLIQALKRVYTQDPVIENLKSLLYSLLRRDFDIVFAWVPSHVGIEGNEEADEEARLTTSSDTQDVDFVKASDLQNYISDKSYDDWQELWNNKTTQLRQIHPKVKSTYPDNKLPRHDVSKLHRLRIGHTQITHGYLLKREHQPLCEHCNEPVTVNHLICECPAYSVMRESCSIRSTLKENLWYEPEIKNTLKFCKLINIYDQL